MKKYYTLIISFLLVVCITVPSFAIDAKKCVFKETEYISTKADDYKNDYPEKITENGKKYKAVSVNYEVTDISPIKETVKIPYSETYEDLLVKSINAPATKDIDYNGNVVTVSLVNTVFNETIVKNRTTTQIAYTDYGYKTEKPIPEKSKTVDYYDEYSKKTVTNNLKLKSFDIKDDWNWKNDVEIPMTAKMYDADYYLINGAYVPYNDEKPAIVNYENNVLSELNLDSNSYKITDAAWVGDKYISENTEYRNAIIKGERYCANYVSTYEDVISLPDAPGYNATAYYEGSVETDSTINQYTYLQTVTYEPDNTALIVSSIALGIVIIALLIVAMLYVLGKKKKKERSEKEYATVGNNLL